MYPFPKLTFFSLAFTVVASFSVLATAASTYHLTDLGVLPGGKGSVGCGVNSLGQVVGYGDAANGISRAIHYAQGKLTDLGAVPDASYYSFAYTINTAGEMAGASENPTGSILWGWIFTGGKLQALEVPGSTQTAVNAINELGEIVGYSVDAKERQHAFQRHPRGQFIDLDLFGGTGSVANAVNNAGQVVGSFTDKDGITHAFLASESGAAHSDLGSLGGNTVANGVNDLGQAVGYSQLSKATADEGQPRHAFLYSNGKLTDLGTLKGASTVAYGINDLGQIVGTATLTAGGSHAFLYASGVLNDLNDLLEPTAKGYVVVQALGINAQGQIVGTATTPNKTSHAVLLTPQE
jgi:probable HAF family extracellular repeat protein